MDKRRWWQRQVAEHGWSTYDLRSMMRRALDSQVNGHGRPIKPAATLELSLLQLISEGSRWAARCELLTAAPAAEKAPASTMKEAAEMLRMVEEAARSAAKAVRGRMRRRS